MITRSARSSKKGEKPKIDAKPKRKDVKNLKNKPIIDENPKNKEVKKSNSVVAKKKTKVEDIENKKPVSKEVVMKNVDSLDLDLSGKSKKNVLKEANMQVGKPEKNDVQKKVTKEAKIKVGKAAQKVVKKHVADEAVEVGKPEEDDVNVRQEKMEVGKPEEADAKKIVRQEEQMEVGKPEKNDVKKKVTKEAKLKVAKKVVKKHVAEEAVLEVGKPEKDDVKRNVRQKERMEVGKPEEGVAKKNVRHEERMEVGKPEKDDVKNVRQEEKMEVGKPEEVVAKKNVLREEKMEVGKPENDVYEFDEIDENVPNKKRKRKVLKITKIRAKRTNNEANMIKKAEINMRTNVHIKHKKTLSDYEKLEFDDINKKPVKIQRKVRIVGKFDENVKMKTPLKILDTNVQNGKRILANSPVTKTPARSPAVMSTPGRSPLVMSTPARSPLVMSTPARSPLVMSTPVRSPSLAMSTPVRSPPPMKTPICHTPIVDFPLSPSSDFSSVYASTPVKYFPVVQSKFDVSNNFGFDADVSLPALSPFVGLKIARKVEEAKKDTISAQEVIKKLRFELNEPDTAEEIETDENMDTTRISVVEEEPRSSLEVYDPTVPEPEMSIRLPRRSYERSFRPKKKKIIAGLIEDEESSEDDEIQPKKYIKKKQPPKEKKNPAMDKWVEEFNKHCKEVEQFNLCVE